MNDNEWLLNSTKKRKEERAAAFSQAKQRAKESGKESYDFEKLSDLYDIRSDFARRGPPPSEETKQRYEQKYYLDYPDVMSIKKFAERLNQLDAYIP